MSDTIALLRRSDIRRLKATNISFPISESISPSFLNMKMSTPSLVSKNMHRFYLVLSIKIQVALRLVTVLV
jgi:hypothetical protein